MKKFLHALFVFCEDKGFRIINFRWFQILGHWGYKHYFVEGEDGVILTSNVKKFCDIYFDNLVAGINGCGWCDDYKELIDTIKYCIEHDIKIYEVEE